MSSSKNWNKNYYTCQLEFHCKYFEHDDWWCKKMPSKNQESVLGAGQEGPENVYKRSKIDFHKSK